MTGGPEGLHPCPQKLEPIVVFISQNDLYSSAQYCMPFGLGGRSAEGFIQAVDVRDDDDGRSTEISVFATRQHRVRSEP